MVATESTWHELYVSLGKLVVASGNLEAAVRNFVVGMIPVAGHNWTRPQLLVDGLSAAQMEDRCARLAYHVLGGSLRQDTIDWLDEVRDLRGKRNGIVHASWSSAADMGDRVIGPAAMGMRVKKPREGLEHKTIAWTASEIDALREKITRAEWRGWELQRELEPFIIAESRDHRTVVPWTRESD